MAETFKPVFGLSGPRDLMRLLEENYRELEAAPDERRLINCIIIAWHMQDWVFRAWLADAKDPEHRKRWAQLSGNPAKSPDERDFKDWLKKECPGSEVLRQVTNHAKHLTKSETGKEMRLHSMLFPHHEPVWSIIDQSTQTPTDVYCRLQRRGTALSDVVEFWRAFLEARPDWQ